MKPIRTKAVAAGAGIRNDGVRRRRLIFFGVSLCLFGACGGRCASGERYVDAPLGRSEVLALHDPPQVIAQSGGVLDAVVQSDNGNRSAETDHLSWAKPLSIALAAGHGAQYVSMERDGALAHLAVHRGASELPETALLRDGQAWRIVRRLPVGRRQDHAEVARWADEGLVPRRHPKVDERLDELKQAIGTQPGAKAVSEAVIALGADAVPLLAWYLEGRRADADELVTAVAALCTGELEVANRIKPRERDPQLAGCLELPDRKTEVCGRGSWVRVNRGERSWSVPSPQGTALGKLEPPSDAIAGALSLCGGPELATRLRRGLAAMLAGKVELALMLQRHDPETLERGVQQVEETARPMARLLLGLGQQPREVTAALSSPALVPILGALECISGGQIQSDGFVLYDAQRDGLEPMVSLLAEGPVASRLVAFELLADQSLWKPAREHAPALARLYVDLSAPDEEALAHVDTLYRCSYVPPWPATRGGASRRGASSPEILLWDLRIGLLRMLAGLPKDAGVDAVLATARQETLRWAVTAVRAGSVDRAEVERQARAALCSTCDRRQILEYGRPSWSECGLIEIAGARLGVRLDWAALAAEPPTACPGPR